MANMSTCVGRCKCVWCVSVCLRMRGMPEEVDASVSRNARTIVSANKCIVFIRGHVSVLCM